MSESIESRVEALLSEVETPRPLKDRCAFALSHIPELVACIRDLQAFMAGQREASTTLVRKATRLRDAVSQLYSNPRGRRDWVDDWRDGTAPDLKPAIDDLDQFLRHTEFQDRKATE